MNSLGGLVQRAKEDIEGILGSGMDEGHITRSLVGLAMRGVYGSAIDILADADEGIDLLRATEGERCSRP